MRPDELEHFLLFSSKKARTQQEDCQNRMNWKLVCQTGYDVLEALEFIPRLRHADMHVTFLQY